MNGGLGVSVARNLNRKTIGAQRKLFERNSRTTYSNFQSTVFSALRHKCYIKGEVCETRIEDIAFHEETQLLVS